MEIIKQLSEETTAKINTYIRENLLPLATAEKAKCAKGRLNLWLQAEPNYSTGKYRAAHSDTRLWSFCQRIFPEAALAQVYFAINNKGIDWHRDASYAHADARIINLGPVLLQAQSRDGDTVSLELTGGEIIAFNSKWLHRAIPRSPDRIGIGLWADKIPMNDPRNWES